MLLEERKSTAVLLTGFYQNVDISSSRNLLNLRKSFVVIRIQMDLDNVNVPGEPIQHSTQHRYFFMLDEMLDVFKYFQRLLTTKNVLF